MCDSFYVHTQGNEYRECLYPFYKFVGFFAAEVFLKGSHVQGKFSGKSAC